MAGELVFVEDVPRWVRSRFGVDLPTERTAVFGVSASGERALAAGLRHPDVYGAIFSLAWRRVPAASHDAEAAPADLPRRRHAGTVLPRERFPLARALGDAGADVVMTERIGSHGDAFWRDELPVMVAWAFGR